MSILTDRESEALIQLAHEDGDMALAAFDLKISVGTYRNLLGDVYRKLGVVNAAGAIAQGYKRGLIPADLRAA